MNSTNQHHLNMYSRLILFLVLISSLVVSCSRTETGILVGVEATFSLDEAISGKIKDMDFGGIVIVKLDDGTKVKAVCDKELWSKLRGGQRLKITPIDSDYWKVLGVIATGNE